jgi:hypothetical protein
MAVVDITIDSVIRRTLAMKGLPIHYYIPMLLYARRGLDEMQFNSLGKVSYAVLTFDAAGQASLPSDYVETVDVVQEVGDKMKALGFGERMNARDTNDTAFSVAADQITLSSSFNSPSLWFPNFYNEFGTGKGRLFGSQVIFHNTYTINRESGFIRLDNQQIGSVKSVTLIYLTTPQKNASSQTVIHPFAQNALIEYLNWKWDEYIKNPDYPNRRKEFYNQYRNLRGMLDKMSTVELMRSLRKHANLSIRN